LFLSTSNLGPLLGIFVTGPLGAIAGMLWGVDRAARESGGTQTTLLLSLLCGTWILTLLYTLFAIVLAARLAAPAIAFQLLVLVATIVFVHRAGVAPKLPRRYRPILPCLMAFVLMTTAFPPVARTAWSSTPHDGAAAIPRFTFILDGRLDASRHVPPLGVDRSLLVLLWIAAALVAGAATIAVRHHPPR
jgi:hypothetical protein